MLTIRECLTIPQRDLQGALGSMPWDPQRVKTVPWDPTVSAVSAQTPGSRDRTPCPGPDRSCSSAAVRFQVSGPCLKIIL